MGEFHMHGYPPVPGCRQCRIGAPMDERRLSDDQIAWFICEYGRTPEHTVFKMAVEIQNLRAHLAYYADDVSDDEGDRARAALAGADD